VLITVLSLFREVAIAALTSFTQSAKSIELFIDEKLHPVQKLTKHESLFEESFMITVLPYVLTKARHFEVL
jgi:hypothetical protein